MTHAASQRKRQAAKPRTEAQNGRQEYRWAGCRLEPKREEDTSQRPLLEGIPLFTYPKRPCFVQGKYSESIKVRRTVVFPFQPQYVFQMSGPVHSKNRWELAEGSHSCQHVLPQKPMNSTKPARRKPPKNCKFICRTPQNCLPGLSLLSDSW